MPHPIRLISAEEGAIRLPALSAPCPGGCRALVSLDYDGTLRHEQSGIHPDFAPTIRSLRAQGVRWGINTGRSLRKLEPELAALPLMPDFICTCERYVYLADAEGRLRPASAYNARCHAANAALLSELLPTWQSELTALRALLPDLKWEIAADDPLSIEARDSSVMDALMPHLLRFAASLPLRHIKIQRAGRFMRFSDANFSKGSALRYLQQLWSVPEDHIFLMGDGHNDLDAFACFPRAYCAAPESAHHDVLAWIRAHGGRLAPDVPHALRHWQQTSL